MKPRISRYYARHDFYHSIRFWTWLCQVEGEVHFAYGRSPREAYANWAKPRWPPGAFIEQHLCPPKPSRIDRMLWNSYDYLRKLRAQSC